MSASAVAAARTPGPEEVWRALAPRLAARGRMRVSRDGGRSYRAVHERLVTERLPNQPAALLVYDHDGCAPVICLDLDTSRGDVDRDYGLLAALLNRAGAAWFSDHVPRGTDGLGGGRHIYVPLACPAPLHEVSDLLRGLAAQAPTLDIQPMLSAHSGCIRPPGSRHRSGRHQTLDQTITAAVEALRNPCSAETWRRLCAAVSPAPDYAVDPSPVGEGAPNEDTADESTPLEPLAGYVEPDEEYQRIARTGLWDPARYRSASEARQAVLWAAAASGWRLVDVARRTGDGTWLGLRSLYARYSPRHRHTALARDWHRAVAFEKRRRGARADSHVRLRTTSTQQSQRGATVTRQVRVWLAAVDLLSPGTDLPTRAVLYALAEAAALTGSMIVEHGNRSLAIATGLDQATVGRVLRRLRDASRDRLLIDLVRPAEGVRAHCYALVVPPLLAPACERRPWRRGRIHAVRGAFRELGLPAAFLYAALEQADEPMSGRELARRAGLGHSAGHDALAVLVSWGLARRQERGWVRGTVGVDRLGERLGCPARVARQVARYRAERLAWWRRLGLVLDEPPRDPWPTDPEAPRGMRDGPSPGDAPGTEARLLALLAERLGARPA